MSQEAFEEERLECGCSVCTPEEWSESERGVLPSGLRLLEDYPSLIEPPHFPPMRLLLDSCVVQHFVWARERAPATDDELGWRRVRAVRGPAMTLELQALAGLLDGVEVAIRDFDELEYSPFAVSRTSWCELAQAPRHRRDALLAEWRLWRTRTWDIADSFDEERAPSPHFSSLPEEMGWHPDQLSLPGIHDPVRDACPLGPFVDSGDVALIREALLLGAEGILTTDLKFWRHRRWLFKQGIEVWRPSDLCWAAVHEAFLIGRSYRFLPAWPNGELLQSRFS